MARIPARSISLLLASLLLVNFAPAVSSTGAAGPDPIASNARTGATYATIQAALDAASTGDTITVINSSATPAAAYAQGLSIATNGITLCATLALNVCADHNAPGRWEISQPNNAVFADPPVPFQGQAVQMGGGAGSTSYYPNSNNPTSTAPKLHVRDITTLSFDMLLDTGGSCGGGSPRIQFGVDTDGDGAKDLPATLSVYPTPSGFCPTPGQWTHVDLMGARWVHTINGGGTTYASAASHYGDYAIVTMNLIWDGSTSTAWFDNERVNDHILRDQLDTTCLDPESPSCSSAFAQPNTILSGGCYPVTITGDGVTVRGFTIQNPGCTQVDQDFGPFDPTLVTIYAKDVTIQDNILQQPASALQPGQSRWAIQGIYIDGATGKGARILDNTIKNIPTAKNADGTCANSPCRTVGVWAREDTVLRGNTISGDAAGAGNAFGVLVSAPGTAGFTIDHNSITNWAHTGVYVAGSSNGPGAITNNVITGSRNNALLIEGTRPNDPLTVTGNDLRTSTNTNVYIDSNRPLSLHENQLGLSNSTISFTERFPGFNVDATQNHWGAYKRGDIQATFRDAGSHTVNIDCYYDVDGTTTICPPTAGFTFSPNAPHINVGVAFTDASTEGGRTIASTAWTFGDGATSTAASPTHAYARSGTFTVTQTVTDNEGAESTSTQTIGVSNTAPVIASIAAQTVAENSFLQVTAHATDADSDTITYSATGVPSGATFTAVTHQLAWTPSYTQAGVYTVTVHATDGDLVADMPFTITVTNVDRAPTMGAIASPTVLEGATLTTNFASADADGDAIVLTTSALPAFMTFTDLGTGAGKIVSAPLVGDHGAYPVTITATSGSLTASRTFTVNVVANAILSLTPVGATTVHASPGAVTLTAHVTNGGAQTDTISFVAAGATGWTVTGPASVTLAPGDSTDVTLTVNAPASSSRATIRLTGTSALNPAVSRQVQWTVDVPVTITITIDSATLTGGVQGHVNATFLNGSPLVGGTIRVMQAPTTLGGTFATTVSGVTGPDGSFTFDFGTDLNSRLPMTHDLTVTLVTGTPVIAHGSYDVDAS